MASTASTVKESQVTLVSVIVCQAIATLFGIIALATPWMLMEWTTTILTVEVKADYSFFLTKLCIEGSGSDEDCEEWGDIDGNSASFDVDEAKSASSAAFGLCFIAMLLSIATIAVAVVRMVKVLPNLVTVVVFRIAVVLPVVALLFSFIAAVNYVTKDFYDPAKWNVASGSLERRAGPGVVLAFLNTFGFLLGTVIWMMFFPYCCQCCKEGADAPAGAGEVPVAAPVGYPAASAPPAAYPAAAEPATGTAAASGV